MKHLLTLFLFALTIGMAHASPPPVDLSGLNDATKCFIPRSSETPIMIVDLKGLDGYLAKVSDPVKKAALSQEIVKAFGKSNPEVLEIVRKHCKECV